MDTIQKDDVSRDPYGSVGGGALHALKEVMQRALAVVAPLSQRILLQEMRHSMIWTPWLGGGQQWIV